MKAILFIRPQAVDIDKLKLAKLKKDLRINNMTLELEDPSSAKGSDRAQIYDLLDFPALIILREDGGIQGSWQGEIPDYSQISQAAGYI